MVRSSLTGKDESAETKVMIDSVNLDTLSREMAGECISSTDTARALPVDNRSLSEQLSPNAQEFEARLAKSKLFDLGQIDIQWEAEMGTLWAFSTPNERPNYNPAMLRDATTWLEESRRVFGGADSPLRFMVLGSRFPNVFNMGGDLDHFAKCIENQDRDKLREYGHACIQIVDRLWNCNSLPIINIGLAQGDALGGGLEALMCFDVIIAEKHARFGLPESLFGLFPGMGAWSILSRKLGAAAAQRMILSGKVYTAEEMHDMGLVTILAETGEGEQVARNYIARHKDNMAGLQGMFHAGRRVHPMEITELRDIVDTWVDSALKLSDKSLRLMRKLAAAQTRLHQQNLAAQG
jgi:DSF synthase